MPCYQVSTLLKQGSAKFLSLVNRIQQLDLAVKTRLWRGRHNLQGYSSVSQHAPTSAARRSAFLRRRLNSPARKLQWKCHLQPRPNRPLLRSMLQRRQEVQRGRAYGIQATCFKDCVPRLSKALALPQAASSHSPMLCPQKTRCCV